MAKASAFIGLKIEPELHDALKVYARTRGGISKVLREVIVRELESTGWEASPVLSKEGGPAEIKVRLKPDESEAVQRVAGDRGMSPGRWVKAMIRSHCLRKITLSPHETSEWREVAKAIRGFSGEIRSLDAPSAAAAARALNTQALRMVADGIQGDLSYWDNPVAQEELAA